MRQTAHVLVRFRTRCAGEQRGHRENGHQAERRGGSKHVTGCAETTAQRKGYDCGHHFLDPRLCRGSLFDS